MGGKRKTYDDYQLVQALALGAESVRRIAERFGLSIKNVEAILAGEYRPRLRELIFRARRLGNEEAERVARGWVCPLLKKQIHVGIQEGGETARKSREYTLDRFLVPPRDLMKDAGAAEGPPPPQLPGLTAEDLQAIARLKGGPEDPAAEEAARADRWRVGDAPPAGWACPDSGPHTGSHTGSRAGPPPADNQGRTVKDGRKSEGGPKVEGGP